MHGKKRALSMAAGLAICAGVVLAQPRLAHAMATTCRINQLPVPAAAWRSDVNAGDPTGRYLVGEAAVGAGTEGRLVPLLWIDGRLVDFSTPYASATLVDVNASGTILGLSDDSGVAFAWLYRRGHFTRLPGLQATDATHPVAINGHGDAVGYADDTIVGSHEPRRDMVLWPAGRPGAVRNVNVSGPTNLVDIDDDGTIIGVGAGTEPTSLRSYRWRLGGAPHVLLGPSGTTDIGVISIRNGWVSGFENVFPVNAFTHSLRGRGFNQVAGMGSPYSSNGRGDLGLFSTIAHHDGRIVTLPGLGAGSAQAPRVLSDNGQAAGFANDGVQVHAVTWQGC
jgi:hypothetical protein